MRKTLAIIGLTLLMLAGMDLGVRAVLSMAEARGQLPTLVNFFEFGRSVPGKVERMAMAAETGRGGLYGVAWMDRITQVSAERFVAETPPPGGFAVRSYGMSFTGHMLRAAAEVTPEMLLDLHGGPGAPPNFTMAMFEADGANRRPGDIAVLGVLADSVPALAALSNRTWAFEQPAPATYPIYRPDAAGGLRRIDPLIMSLEDQERLRRDPALRAAWRAQLAAEDAFFGPVSYGAEVLDASPFARLVRRSLAVTDIARRKQAVRSGEAFPAPEVLRRLVVRFAEAARAEGTVPLVLLVQGRKRSEIDLKATLADVLEAHTIPYFASVDHQDPRDGAAFVADGHYTDAVNAVFGAALSAQLRELAAR